MSIKKIRELATRAGKKLVYNRCTGEYQIVDGATRSFGVTPARDARSKLHLSERDINFLLSCI